MSEAQESTHGPSSAPSSYPSSYPVSTHGRQDSQISTISTSAYPTLTAEHLRLKMRLSPLTQVETSLVRKLTMSTPEKYDNGNSWQPGEACVNSATPWKVLFGRMTNNTRSSQESDHLIDWDDPNDPGVVLHACADDIKRLWNDPIIQKLLEVQKLRVEEVAGL